MKKIISILVCLLMAVGVFAGCSNNADKTDEKMDRQASGLGCNTLTTVNILCRTYA